MKILLMWIKLVWKNEKNKWYVKYIQMLTAPAQCGLENIREGLR